MLGVLSNTKSYIELKDYLRKFQAWREAVAANPEQYAACFSNKKVPDPNSIDDINYILSFNAAQGKVDRMEEYFARYRNLALFSDIIKNQPISGDANKMATLQDVDNSYYCFRQEYDVATGVQEQTQEVNKDSFNALKKQRKVYEEIREKHGESLNKRGDIQRRMSRKKFLLFLCAIPGLAMFVGAPFLFCAGVSWFLGKAVTFPILGLLAGVLPGIGLGYLGYFLLGKARKKVQASLKDLKAKLDDETKNAKDLDKSYEKERDEYLRLSRDSRKAMEGNYIFEADWDQELAISAYNDRLAKLDSTEIVAQKEYDGMNGLNPDWDPNMSVGAETNKVFDDQNPGQDIQQEDHESAPEQTAGVEEDAGLAGIIEEEANNEAQEEVLEVPVEEFAQNDEAEPTLANEKTEGSAMEESAPKVEENDSQDKALGDIYNDDFFEEDGYYADDSLDLIDEDVKEEEPDKEYEEMQEESVVEAEEDADMATQEAHETAEVLEAVKDEAGSDEEVQEKPEQQHERRKNKSGAASLGLWFAKMEEKNKPEEKQPEKEEASKEELPEQEPEQTQEKQGVASEQFAQEEAYEENGESEIADTKENASKTEEYFDKDAEDDYDYTPEDAEEYEEEELGSGDQLSDAEQEKLAVMETSLDIGYHAKFDEISPKDYAIIFGKVVKRKEKYENEPESREPFKKVLLAKARYDYAACVYYGLFVPRKYADGKRELEPKDTKLAVADEDINDELSYEELEDRRTILKKRKDAYDKANDYAKELYAWKNDDDYAEDIKKVEAYTRQLDEQVKDVEATLVARRAMIRKIVVTRLEDMKGAPSKSDKRKAISKADLKLAEISANETRETATKAQRDESKRFAKVKAPTKRSTPAQVEEYSARLDEHNAFQMMTQKQIDAAEKDGALIRAGIVYKSVNWQTVEEMEKTLARYRNDPAMLEQLRELLQVSNKNNKKSQTVKKVKTEGEEKTPQERENE
ncbi:MAG: hypothetical protein IJS68_01325 [Clostridia bacterium]|nr:hypothetical protein [Clostridia bacterium]